jgi:hypothetical protein
MKTYLWLFFCLCAGSITAGDTTKIHFAATEREGTSRALACAGFNPGYGWVFKIGIQFPKVDTHTPGNSGWSYEEPALKIIEALFNRMKLQDQRWGNALKLGVPGWCIGHCVLYLRKAAWWWHLPIVCTSVAIGTFLYKASERTARGAFKYEERDEKGQAVLYCKLYDPTLYQSLLGRRVVVKNTSVMRYDQHGCKPYKGVYNIQNNLGCSTITLQQSDSQAQDVYSEGPLSCLLQNTRDLTIDELRRLWQIYSDWQRGIDQLSLDKFQKIIQQ